MNITIVGSEYKNLNDNLTFVQAPYEVRSSNADQKDLEKNWQFPIASLDDKQLIELKKFLSKNSKKNALPLKQIEKWEKLIKDPINAPVKTLESFESLLNKLFSFQKTKILFQLMGDGSFMPIIFDSCKFYKDEEEGRVFILKFKYQIFTFKRNRYSDDDDTEDAKLKEETDSFYFYRKDLLLEKDADNIFDDEDSDNEKNNKLSLFDVLKKKDLYAFSEEIFNIYKIQLENFFSILEKTGKEFNATGKAIISNNNWWYSENNFSKIDTKVVIERVDSIIFSKMSLFLKQIGMKKEFSPIHPYIKAFDLINHRYILILPENLEMYVYDKNMINKLVLSNEKRIC